jgi:hypothetical protein
MIAHTAKSAMIASTNSTINVILGESYAALHAHDVNNVNKINISEFVYILSNSNTYFVEMLSQDNRFVCTHLCINIMIHHLSSLFIHNVYWILAQCNKQAETGLQMTIGKHT